MTQFFVCLRCLQSKPENEFYADRRMVSGYSNKCQACTYTKKLPLRWAQWKAEGRKPCNICRVSKPFSDFRSRRGAPLDLDYVCKACQTTDYQERLLSRADPEERNRIQERIWRADKKAQGLCTRCGKAPIWNRSSCKPCLDKRRFNAMTQDQQWRKLGRCYKCGKKRATGSTLCLRHLQRAGELELAKRRRLRMDVIEYLGRVCACCGEATLGFLTLDHSNDDGHRDSRARKDKTSFLRAILRGDRPDIRLLCFNCNCGRAANSGVCPHEETKQQLPSLEANPL